MSEKEVAFVLVKKGISMDSRPSEMVFRQSWKTFNPRFWEGVSIEGEFTDLTFLLTAEIGQSYKITFAENFADTQINGKSLRQILQLDKKSPFGIKTSADFPKIKFWNSDQRLPNMDYFF